MHERWPFSSLGAPPPHFHPGLPKLAGVTALGWPYPLLPGLWRCFADMRVPWGYGLGGTVQREHRGCYNSFSCPSGGTACAPNVLTLSPFLPWL